MKITKSKLKKIIQEEAAAVLLEQAGLSGASFGAPSLPDFNNSYDEDLPPTGEDDATGPYARLLSTLNTLSKASAAAANIPTQEGVAALNHLAVADQLTLNMSMVIDAYNKLARSQEIESSNPMDRLFISVEKDRVYVSDSMKQDVERKIDRKLNPEDAP